MRKKLLTALIVLICLGVLAGCAAVGWVVYQEAHAGDEMAESDVIIVLGARVKPDGTFTLSPQKSAALQTESSTAQKKSRNASQKFSKVQTALFLQAKTAPQKSTKV